MASTMKRDKDVSYRTRWGGRTTCVSSPQLFSCQWRGPRPEALISAASVADKTREQYFNSFTYLRNFTMKYEQYLYSRILYNISVRL